MNKIIKRTRQLSELSKLSKNKHVFQAIRVGADKELLQSAKRLHASVYLDLGFIKESDISPRGFIAEASDPHQAHSNYFVVTNKNDTHKRVLAAARQIYVDEAKQYNSFPIIEKAKLYSGITTKIQSYEPKEIVEISALVKAPGASSLVPLVLYKAMLDYSLDERKHKVWLMALDTNVYKKMNYHFGSVLSPIGHITSYNGGDVVPLMLHTDQVFHVMKEELNESRLLQRHLRKLLLDFFTSDLSFELDATK